MDERTVDRIPLFAETPRRQRRLVARLADELHVPSGMTLTREGHLAREFCVIVSGSAEVRRHGQRAAELGPGDFFGEAGMLGSAPTHAATVVTTSDVHLLVMGRREFASMMWRLPAVAERIRRQAAVEPEPDSSVAWRDVDATGDGAAFSAYLDAVNGLGPVHAGKRRRDRLLATPGTLVLDVGCGTGEDARAMAQLVGPDGQVVGVDASPGLLSLAWERAKPEDGRVEWVRADARALPFADGCFDAVRAERLLQHVEDPQAVVAELVRVTRPDGRVALVEPDWGTLAVDVESPEVASEVEALAAEGIRWPWAGRSLQRWLQAAGLAEVEVEPEPHALAPDELPAAAREQLFGPLADRARAAGLASAGVLENARRGARADGLFACVVLFAGYGRRPGEKSRRAVAWLRRQDAGADGRPRYRRDPTRASAA